MKQHSRDCIKFWRMGCQLSSLNHMDVNIQKIIIMFWEEKFQEMAHFIIIYWFNRSCVFIWDIFRVKFNWKSEGWTSTSPLSMAWWLSIPIISETTGLVLGVDILNLNWSYGVLLLQYIVGSFGSSPWRALNWFIFLIKHGGSNLGPQMIQSSSLCPILPQHSQILLCMMQISAITVWRVSVSFLMED